MVELSFYFGQYCGQQHKQRQQTNNIMMSSCIFGNLISIFGSWIIFENIGDHSKLSTLRLWLPVSMMSFSHFFVLTQRQFLLFIHSYCHHFGGPFTVELHYTFGHYWGQHHQQQQQINNIMINSNNNTNNNTLGIILN
jgi:hypothetical protein